MVSIVWTHGLTGQALGLGKGPHRQHQLPEPRPLSDFYSVADSEIGHGAYGTCIPGTHRATQRPCIVKVVDRARAGPAYVETFVTRDVYRTLLEIADDPHPNVVQYLDFLVGPDLCFPVMEVLRGAELFDDIIANAPVGQGFCQCVMRQVLGLRLSVEGGQEQLPHAPPLQFWGRLHMKAAGALQFTTEAHVR